MKGVLLFFLLFTTCKVLLAQTLQVAVSTTNAEVNERVVLQYSFDGGNLPGNLIPKVDNMMVVGGPSLMQGSNSINGVVTNTSQLTYEVIFTKPGKYAIPKVAVQTKNKKFMCQTVTINIVKGNNSNPIFPPGYEGKELIIVMEANKKKVFLGEPIAIDLTIYSIFNNVSMSSIDYPPFDGGWTQDATDAFNEQLTESSYRGKVYYKCVLRRVWMVPIILGNIEFKPVDANFHAAINDQRTGYMEFNYNSKSESVQFEVVDLPVEKKPESFINAMGEFSWTIKIDKSTAKANEPVKAIINITGVGNFPVLEAPVLNLPDEFEIFEPNVKSNYKVEIKGINGSKQFEFLIMPRKEGAYWLGPFSFSYFNPATKKYTELKSDSFLLNIKGIIADTTAGKTFVNNGIFTEEKIYKKSKPFFGNPFYYLLLALPFLTGLGMIIFRKKLFFTKKDDSEKKLRHAEDRANKSLSEVKALLDNGKEQQALGVLSGLFFQYISDKFKVNKNEVTRSNIEKWLADISLKVAGSKILDQLDQFRFAPAAKSDLNALYNNIKSFVDELGRK